MLVWHYIVSALWGHVTIRTAEGPSIVRFRSISHMWEAMEHPDPWGFQVRSIVERYRELPKDSVTWVFVDFMSLYQYKRSAEEDEFFRKGLKRMHWLYSHEIVQVDILTELTPEDKKFEGEILVYNAAEDQMKETPIRELKLNSTPYELRGWCQSESEWSRLRMDVLGGCVPTPPEIFRKRMQRMRFTHRNDAEQVLALQEKVFRDKVSRTTHLQLQQLSLDDLECLHDALPHYSKLEYLVVNGNALKGQDAVAMVTSGAADIQMESCSLQDEDADAMAEALMSSAADRLEHLSLTGNRFLAICSALFYIVLNLWNDGMFFSPPSRKDERRCWSLWDEKMLKWTQLEVVAARLQWHRDSCPSQSDGAATAAEDPIVDLEWFRYIQIDLDGQSDGLLPSCDTTSLWNHVGISINGDTPKWMVYNGKFFLNGWFRVPPFQGTTM